MFAHISLVLSNSSSLLSCLEFPHLIIPEAIETMYCFCLKYIIQNDLAIFRRPMSDAAAGYNKTKNGKKAIY